MLRGLFTNRTVRNQLDPADPAGLHAACPDPGEILPLWRAAERYRSEGQPRSSSSPASAMAPGSSRDWAAKGLGLLGVRAVLASSFERIHRSNLIGMGILPFRLPPTHASQRRCGFRPGDRIEIDAAADRLAPRCRSPSRSTAPQVQARPSSRRAAVETGLEVEILRVGGIIPFILRRAFDAAAQAATRTATEITGNGESLRRQSSPIIWTLSGDTGLRRQSHATQGRIS